MENFACRRGEEDRGSLITNECAFGGPESFFFYLFFFSLCVCVSAPLAPLDSCGGQLHRASMAKAARYHTHLDGTLPGDLTFVPLTHSATVPFLHVSALRLLHRLVKELAERTMSPLSATWGIHFARLKTLSEPENL